eukprot:12753352-Alexandrium_andersonii.AAC.1
MLGSLGGSALPSPSEWGGLGAEVPEHRARGQPIETCEIAGGGRSLSCAGPGTISNSTPEGLVQGVRHHFAR